MINKEKVKHIWWLFRWYILDNRLMSIEDILNDISSFATSLRTDDMVYRAKDIYRIVKQDLDKFEKEYDELKHLVENNETPNELLQAFYRFGKIMGLKESLLKFYKD